MYQIKRSAVALAVALSIVQPHQLWQTTQMVPFEEPLFK
jgi:hypothetical protein